jgi:serine/threonine-protein kinase RsbW
MARVDVSFTPLPSHVRTARLVALAMARRVGVPEEMLDEVRLAVGEACSRAVGVHAELGPDTPIEMVLSDEQGRFTVEVSDIGPLEDNPAEEPFGPFDATSLPAGVDGAVDALPSGFGLVVIGGIVDELVVTSDDRGTHVQMVWPAGRSRPGGG